MPPARLHAISTVQVDNERVIVTGWRFAPAVESGPTATIFGSPQ